MYDDDSLISINEKLKKILKKRNKKKKINSNIKDYKELLKKAKKNKNSYSGAIEKNKKELSKELLELLEPKEKKELLEKDKKKIDKIAEEYLKHKEERIEIDINFFKEHKLLYNSDKEYKLSKQIEEIERDISKSNKIITKCSLYFVSLREKLEKFYSITNQLKNNLTKYKEELSNCDKKINEHSKQLELLQKEIETEFMNNMDKMIEKIEESHQTQQKDQEEEHNMSKKKYNSSSEKEKDTTTISSEIILQKNNNQHLNLIKMSELNNKIENYEELLQKEKIQQKNLKKNIDDLYEQKSKYIEELQEGLKWSEDYKTIIKEEIKFKSYLESKLKEKKEDKNACSEWIAEYQDLQKQLLQLQKKRARQEEIKKNIKKYEELYEQEDKNICTYEKKITLLNEELSKCEKELDNMEKKHPLKKQPKLIIKFNKKSNKKPSFAPTLGKK